MNILIIIIIVIILTPSALVLASVMTLSPRWKYYRKIYKTLDYTKFSRFGDMLISEGDSKNEFIYFSNGDLKLKENIYLFDWIITYLDPYSFYWLRKYQKYFKNFK